MVPKIVIIFVVTVFIAIIVQLLPLFNKLNLINEAEHLQKRLPTYAIHTPSREIHLMHIINILTKFGYKRVELDEGKWDLLWSHPYPYRQIPNLNHLGTHQLVNHFPGCGYLTNKVNLSTTRLPFLPRAFGLPTQKEEFLEYAAAHPDALFVEKNNRHRHIRIRASNDINLYSNDSFVQEFIQKPFLVDGHKFDIGVYVVITSINPLRVYIYTGDVMFRYCPVKYYPFDTDNVDKYVVGDNFLPTWKIPSLLKYFDTYGGSMRAAFEAYVRDQSMDPSKIWPQVESIIRTTILAKERNITDVLASYKTHNFFELFRFDMFIDEDLKVYLMEANMSPNLSSVHFKRNALIYEQVIYSVFNLVGILPVSEYGNRRAISFEMLTANKSLVTSLNKCKSFNCEKSCNRDECDLCLPCINGTEYDWLVRAHEEHLHRVDMKRIFPQPIYDLQRYDIDLETKNLSKRNALMSRWFYEKCKYDRNWCT